MTTATPEIAISLTRGAEFTGLVKNGVPPTLAQCRDALQWPYFPYPGPVADLPVSHVHLGNEFCDRLLPEASLLQRHLDLPGIHLALVTPTLSDTGLKTLGRILQLLPPGSEVIVNDWGALRLLRQEHTELIPVLGRLLCKMIKDPRQPGGNWSRLYPGGVTGGSFNTLLERWQVGRVELDVPPAATGADLGVPDTRVSLHLPYGYVFKGRMCRIGSMHLPPALKFTPGHSCRRECLQYVETTRRPQAVVGEPPTFQRGNTLFYRYSEDMVSAALAAVEAGRVDRLIVQGDWHEDHRTH